MNFRKKPVVIEAIQWAGGENVHRVLDFCKGSEVVFEESFVPDPAYPKLFIKTLEGNMMDELEALRKENAELRRLVCRMSEGLDPNWIVRLALEKDCADIQAIVKQEGKS